MKDDGDGVCTSARTPATGATTSAVSAAAAAADATAAGDTAPARALPASPISEPSPATRFFPRRRDAASPPPRTAPPLLSFLLSAERGPTPIISCWGMSGSPILATPLPHTRALPLLAPLPAPGAAALAPQSSAGRLDDPTDATVLAASTWGLAVARVGCAGSRKCGCGGGGGFVCSGGGVIEGAAGEDRERESRRDDKDGLLPLAATETSSRAQSRRDDIHSRELRRSTPSRCPRRTPSVFGGEAPRQIPFASAFAASFPALNLARKSPTPEQPTAPVGPLSLVRLTEFAAAAAAAAPAAFAAFALAFIMPRNTGSLSWSAVGGGRGKISGGQPSPSLPAEATSQPTRPAVAFAGDC